MKSGTYWNVLACSGILILSGNFFCLFFFCHFLGQGFHSPGWPPTRYMFDSSLELLTLLSAPASCWDYRHMPAFDTSLDLVGIDDDWSLP